MVGKSVMDEDALHGALQLLSSEISPSMYPVAATVEYRKILAMGLFYKVHLVVTPCAHPILYKLVEFHSSFCLCWERERVLA